MSDKRIEQLIDQYGAGASKDIVDKMRAITLLEPYSNKDNTTDLIIENSLLRNKCNELSLYILKMGLRRSTFRSF